MVTVIYGATVIVVTRCFVVTGSSRHSTIIIIDVVCVVGLGACAAGVWVEACPSDTYACMLSSDDMDLCGLVSPPPGAKVHFPVITNV